MPMTSRDSLDIKKLEWLAQIEAVLEVLNEGVIVANDRHRILFANSRFVEMTGISRQELIEFDPSRFYSSEERDFLKQQVDVAFQAGHNRYAFVLPRKGGGRLPVIISSRTFKNSSDRFGIVTFTDISEQVQSRGSPPRFVLRTSVCPFASVPPAEPDNGKVRPPLVPRSGRCSSRD